MLVDDDVSNLALVERVLSAAGDVVESAADAAAPLDILKARGRFDVYVLDFMMPGMDGKELADTIRRDHPDARILYFTLALYEAAVCTTSSSVRRGGSGPNQSE